MKENKKHIHKNPPTTKNPKTQTKKKTQTNTPQKIPEKSKTREYVFSLKKMKKILPDATERGKARF